jgi:hypothetical protein
MKFERRTLALLGDALLPKLLSGEVRASAVAEAMADKEGVGTAEMLRQAQHDSVKRKA